MDLKNLLDGNKIPILGFGTYQLRGNTGYKAIKHAIETGYRHIDTAAFYNNEDKVGEAIRSTSIDRDEIFITTKVWTSDLGYNQTKRALSESLQKLNMDYVDLYLIHWPGNNKSRRLKSWKAMEEMKNEGKIKSIGVSNFSPAQIEEITNSMDQMPVVNQINFSPFNYNQRGLQYCNNQDIAVTAHTPLNKGRKLNKGIVKELADKYDRTGAQIVLRWSVQKGVVVIPKSENPDRIEENSNIFNFSISEKDIQKLDNLE